MRNRGFTLIELLVVIAIVGVLSTIVLVSVNGSRRGAEASKVLEAHQTITQAFEIWMGDTGLDLYPDQDEYSTSGAVCGNDEPPLSATDLFANVQNLQGWEGPYLQSVPTMPWGAEFTYDNDSDTWPDDGSNAGVNLMMQYCTSANGTRAHRIAERIDRIVDNNDGRTVGKIRWSSSTSSGAVRILLSPEGD